ncbi:MAG: hypothetical protein M3N91_19220 [Pseudomonadota bacterium]|nr:hypothetical protein [Pseudomonadota bacterium]
MIKLIAALIVSLSSVATVVGLAVVSVAAPEIDASSAMGALTLLLGGVMVLRSRVATKR